MTGLPSAVAAGRVHEIAGLLRLDAVRMIAIQEHFDSGNTGELVRAVGSLPEGFAVRLIQGALLEALALSCTRACDSHDWKSERHSIPTARALLLDPAAFDLAAKPPGNSAALSRFLQLADEIAVSYSQETLRALRDFKVAHHLPTKFAIADTAQINHLWNTTEAVLQAIYYLSVGTGTNLVGLDSEAKVWGGRCKAYWHRLINGPASASE